MSEQYPMIKTVGRLSAASYFRTLHSGRPALISALKHGGIFFVMIALMLIIKEEFPFSNFPMYSLLPDSTICLQLTDAENHVVPIWPAFGGSITVLKKQLNHELSMVQNTGAFKKRDETPPEILHAAGTKVLTWMLTHFKCADPKLRGQVIRLQQVKFRVRDHKVSREVETLAEDHIPSA